MPSDDGVSPALHPGERVSLLARSDDALREVIGFITTLSNDAIAVVDRTGVEHEVRRADIEALRRVGVALGRRPEATPRDLLDGLAERAGVVGVCWVGRISALLEGRTPPAAVPAWGERATFDGAPARFEGEWVTLASASDDIVVAAAWWATRMGARSVQVRGDAAPAGFTRLG